MAFVPFLPSAPSATIPNANSGGLDSILSFVDDAAAVASRLAGSAKQIGDAIADATGSKKAGKKAAKAVIAGGAQALDPPAEGFSLSSKVAGIPVWGWGAGAVALVAAILIARR